MKLWSFQRNCCKEDFLKSKKNRTEEDEALIETYGGKLDFKNPDAIRPIVEFVRKTMKSRR